MHYRVLFVASECAPYAKVGGLADVVGALPKALRRMGHDARIVLPLYRDIQRPRFDIQPDGNVCVHMGGNVEHWAGVWTAKLDNEVPVWFIDFEQYFGRPGIYDTPAGEYKDNAFRFTFLSKAALQLCKDRGFIPHIAHVHDWPSAPTALLLKTWDKILSPLSETASVLTIHNIAYQGVYDPSVFPYMGVGWEHFNADTLEDHGKVNLLKCGVRMADAITTVSPTHAAEIRTPGGGHGLAPALNNRALDFSGILNGADYEHWDPVNDTLIPARYSANDLSGKARCKAELQRRLGLEVRPDLPLFGIVCRFAPQKGFDLLRSALPRALDTMAMQVAILGTGNPDTENFCRHLSWSHPGRAADYIGFSNELSHWIEAGSDFFLMPSLFEPCGLNQIYSMRYGTLPLVRAVGGLEDTVENYNEFTGAGTGFKFHLPTAGALYDTIGWAVSTWYDRPHHVALLRKQAMAQDFSWHRSADEYVRVYDQALRRRAAWL
jgi:starch synthase